VLISAPRPKSASGSPKHWFSNRPAFLRPARPHRS